MAELDLITIVAQHKDEARLLEAALAAGAPGATYFYGRGTGVRQTLGFWGNFVEAEKIIIMLGVPPAKTEAVVRAVADAGDLTKPGNGFVCVQKIQQLVGSI